MKRILTLATAVGVLATQPLLAEDNVMSPKWNNIELDFVSLSIDDLNKVDPKGISLTGTKLITEDIFAVAGYSYLEDDYMNVDIELETYTLGLGMKKSVSKSTDLFGTLTYEHKDVNGFNDDGMALTLGVRHILNNNFELGAKIENERIAGEDGFSINANAHYLINNNVSVGVGYTIGEESKTANIGVRYSF
jgi:hypothetical protein